LGSSSYGAYGTYDGGTNYGALGSNGAGVVGVGVTYGVSSSGQYGVWTTGTDYGVYATGTNAAGVRGCYSGDCVNNYGSLGTTSGYGVWGYSNDASTGGAGGGGPNTNSGQLGRFDATSNYGVYGSAIGASTTTTNYGVYGIASGETANYGVYGDGTLAGVYGTGDSYGGYFQDTDTSGNDYGIFAIANGAGGTTHYGVYGSASGATTNWAGYFNGNTYVGGDFGIGTAPGAQLHLSGGAWDLSTTEGDFKIGDATYRLKIGTSLSGAGAGIMRIRSHGGKAQIILGSNTTDTLAIGSGTNTNYVGIGTITPAYNLEIGTGDVNTVGGGYRDSGACVAGTCASDLRLKKNLAPIQGSLEKILLLKPYTFQFIDAKYGSEKQNYGLIAQDVETVFPEWVISGEDGYKSIRYGLNIDMNVIVAIQEQQRLIEELKMRNNALQQLVCLDHPDADVCRS
jgi:hypothetical protein